MIHLQFTLSLWSRREFQNLFCRGGTTFLAHKHWEFQAFRDRDLVAFCLELTRERDHAGFRLSVTFMTWGAEFNWYDARHWDYLKNCWETS